MTFQVLSAHDLHHLGMEIGSLILEILDRRHLASIEYILNLKAA